MKIHAHFAGRILCGAHPAVAKNIQLELWIALDDSKRCKKCRKVHATAFSNSLKQAFVNTTFHKEQS